MDYIVTVTEKIDSINAINIVAPYPMSNLSEIFMVHHQSVYRHAGALYCLLLQ